MANTIKHKRGSGSDPSASDLAVGELAIRTDTGVVFTKKDDGTVAEIAGGGDTDLGVSTTSTAVTVTSSTGNNATISEASSSAAGVMSAAHHDKLDGIATGAEVNVATNLSKTTTTTTNVIASSTGTNVTLNEATGSAAGLMSTTHHNKLDGIESGATADQTASEILTLIKTVDGEGSGLDADRLDGLTQGDFLRANADDNVTAHTEWQDGKEVRLGNGADMKLYHSSGVNYIEVAQDLLIRHGSETMIRCNDDADVELYYNNSKKLETKSDGVDITGELQCDSLDVDGAANITGNLDINENIRHNGDTNNYIGFPAADTFRVVTGGTERLRVTSTGAIAIEGSSNYGTSGQVLTSNGNDAPTWQDGGGTVASGCIYENSQTISANYSITSGKNAMSAGPITISSGVTVTVTSGSTYTIV